MIVYVVEKGVYAESDIVGIYSSVEKAIAAHPAPGEEGGPPLRAIPGEQTDPTPDKLRDGGWQEDDGRWHNGFDMGWCCEIYSFPVDV